MKIAHQPPETIEDLLWDDWKGCTRCPLHETRLGDAVLGEGNPNADIVLVGEAPGRQEEEEAFPFRGASGQLLRDVMDLIELSLDNVWLTNVVACRPPDFNNPRRNRAPLSAEINACAPRLQEEIYRIDPILVVALGSTAAKALGGSGVRVTETRGDIADIKIPSRYVRKEDLCYPLLVTWHPSGVLRRLPEFDGVIDKSVRGVYPKNILRLSTSEDPLDELIWHLLLARSTVALTRAIWSGEPVPQIVRDVASLMP